MLLTSWYSTYVLARLSCFWFLIFDLYICAIIMILIGGKMLPTSWYSTYILARLSCFWLEERCRRRSPNYFLKKGHFFLFFLRDASQVLIRTLKVMLSNHIVKYVRYWINLMDQCQFKSLYGSFSKNNIVVMIV